MSHEPRILGRPAPLWALWHDTHRIECLTGHSRDGGYEVVLVEDGVTVETRRFTDAVSGLRWAIEVEVRYLGRGWVRSKVFGGRV